MESRERKVSPSFEIIKKYIGWDQTPKLFKNKYFLGFIGAAYVFLFYSMDSVNINFFDMIMIK